MPGKSYQRQLGYLLLLCDNFWAWCVLTELDDIYIYLHLYLYNFKLKYSTVTFYNCLILLWSWNVIKVTESGMTESSVSPTITQSFTFIAFIVSGIVTTLKFCQGQTDSWQVWHWWLHQLTIFHKNAYMSTGVKPSCIDKLVCTLYWYFLN